MTSITKYFNGEKLQCSIGIDIALLFIGMGLYFLLYTKHAFLFGISFPFLVISGLLFIICISVVMRTSKDIERVTRYMTSQPENMKTVEIPRMEKVMRNFAVIKSVEVALTLTGVVLAFILPVSPMLAGVGFGLVIQSLVMLGFDHFAEKRGKAYWAYLQETGHM